MTIETKYDTGDTVWVLEDKKAKEYKVRTLSVTKNEKETPLIQYWIGPIGKKYDQSELYPTKQALIDSL